MEDLPGTVDPSSADPDARVIVERLREILASSAAPRDWVPAATFDELLLRVNREAIHLHPAIHHLHHRWDMGPQRRNAGIGKGPKALVLRLFARVVNATLERYFTEEQEFRVALAQSIDALAYRVDEIASSDEREILAMVRDDLLSLSAFVDARTAACGTEGATQ